jgi:CRP-like cAMP-binding protein
VYKVDHFGTCQVYETNILLIVHSITAWSRFRAGRVGERYHLNLESHVNHSGEKVAPCPAPVRFEKQLEDPLSYLPCSNITEYCKSVTIYSQDQQPTDLYLVIDGKVKVSRISDRGQSVVLDIYQNDEFFGESAFVHLSGPPEQAVALQKTKVMTWSASEIVDLTLCRPKLGIALLQLMTLRAMSHATRIESFAVDNIQRRLARSLICFADRFGGPNPASHPRAVIAVRRHLARDRHALYESASPRGIPPVLAKGHTCVS